MAWKDIIVYYFLIKIYIVHIPPCRIYNQQFLFRGLYYKKLRIRNLWEMDRFRSKLASDALDEHTSLSEQAH